MFQVPSYWPFPAAGEVVTNTFASGPSGGPYDTVVQTYSVVDAIPGTGLRGSFSQQVQTIAGQWDSTWYMAINDTGDLYEPADNYPSGPRPFRRCRESFQSANR
jgi:hypothetical protein